MTLAEFMLLEEDWCEPSPDTAPPSRLSGRLERFLPVLEGRDPDAVPAGVGDFATGAVNVGRLIMLAGSNEPTGLMRRSPSREVYTLSSGWVHLSVTILCFIVSACAPWISPVIFVFLNSLRFSRPVAAVQPENAPAMSRVWSKFDCEMWGGNCLGLENLGLSAISSP